MFNSKNSTHQYRTPKQQGHKKRSHQSRTKADLNENLLLEKQLIYVIFFLLATIPIVFGAVHPFMQGLYTAMLLLVCGGWLLYNAPAWSCQQFSSTFLFPPLVLLLYTAFSCLPLPLSIIAMISPARAAAVARVNELAGTHVQWVPLSYAPQSTLRVTIFYFSIILFFYCLRILLYRNRHFFNQLLRLIVIVGCCESIYGLLQSISPSIGVLWLSNKYGSACGTIIYKNQYAAFLNLCWPVAFALGLWFYKKKLVNIAKQLHKHGRRNLRKLKKKLASKSNQSPLYWFATSLIILAVLFSLSRAGMLNMLFIWLVILILLPVPKQKKIILALSILAVVFVFGSILGFETIVRRLALLDESGQARIRLWQSSLAMIKDYVWTGSGLESYRFLSPVYLEHFSDRVFFDRAHNEYIELLIELGVPMALLLFTWLIALIIYCLRIFWHIRNQSFTRTKKTTLVGITSIAAIIGFLLHGTVDFAWRLPANVVYCTTLAALVSHALQRIKLDNLIQKRSKNE